MKQLILSFLIIFGFTSINAQTPESPDFHNTKMFRGASGSYFGGHTVNIGDFNGDGYDDLAVSAAGENSSTGAVYVYFGGENSDLQPDVVFRGTDEWEQLGLSVAGAGDFNGDGYDDLMIATGNYPPTVKLYYGGPDYDQYEDVSFSASYVSVGFGEPMTKLGDINGDGFDDVAIGNGVVEIYLGRPDPVTDLMPDYEINGYGTEVAYCGDVNGDGFDDVLIGNGGNPTVTIFGGSENFDLDFDAFLQGTAGSGFGSSVAGGGDINNDGYSDIVIGAPDENVDGTNAVGKVYVAFGGPNIFDGYTFGYPTSFSYSGSSEEEHFGNTVAILKDMNGDGFDEIGVGEKCSYDSWEENKVFVFYGGNQLNSAPNNVFYSSDKGNLAFHDIASIDFDFDGYGDVVAGDFLFDKAYLYNVANNSPYLFNEFDLIAPVGSDVFGDFNGDGFDDIATTYGHLFINQNGRYTNEHSQGFTGTITFTGDVNGDGFDDVLISADNNLFICWGNNSNNYSPQLFYQDEEGKSFRFTSPADFNGDGFDDIALVRYSSTKNEDGAIYFFYGGTDLSTEPDYIISPYYSAIEVCTIGDFNGDGYDDIIYRPYSYNYNYIQYGSSYGLGTSDVFAIDFEYTTISDYSHSADYNGDGFDDFVVWGYEDEDVNFYLFFGHPELEYSENEAITIPGEIKPTEINGDGITDAVIGSKIIYGSSDFPNNDFVYVPNGDFSYESCGDINNDGFNDLLFKNTIDYSSRIVFNTQQNKAPRFVSVKDVPGDQGGFVTLTWFKSGLDGGKVTSYQIERSIAPVDGDFAWEVIGNVAASRFNYYSYTAPTLNDQTPENTGNTYFRITALTENPDVYYRSNILYGHSVDNLAPAAPGGLKAVREDDEARISWKLNSESDLKDYLIYRSVNEEVDLDTLEVYGSVTDTVFIDEAPLNQSVYYFVRATDIHGNVGDASFVLLQPNGVNDEDGLPREFSLSQNYPNPFNPTTTISYAIPNVGDANFASPTAVKLVVYDALGREVTTLVNAKQAPGNYSVKFNASKLGSGIYFYTLRAGNFVQTKKMVLMK